ncbi:MAG: RNA polymerase sigma factor [Firmicutes bacterium]|nr:RNA polymerase sigma factor [Bacillota bacterium]MBV1728574.1 RNA polymerase sigma factor [Desulforudis sp.]MBV1770475.1 RNA polymerase sigma factor [Desulforudis sp.]
MDRGAAAENHEAVRLLFELFAPKVLAAAFFVIRDRELAEDIMQDTFLTAMHKLHQLHDREKAGAWLTRIAINKAHSEMRKKNRATVADPCVAVPDDTDQALLIEEDAKRLHQAMEQLNADHKLVLHMKPWYGFPQWRSAVSRQRFLNGTRTVGSVCPGRMKVSITRSQAGCRRSRSGRWLSPCKKPR